MAAAAGQSALLDGHGVRQRAGAQARRPRAPGRARRGRPAQGSAPPGKRLSPPGRPRDSLGTPIVGRSPAIQRVLEQVRQVAATDATVLLLGETGTGKELFATQIHDAERAARPRHGAGQLRRHSVRPGGKRAVRPREGRLHRRALAGRSGASRPPTGPRIFLDEIGDLPPEVQVKLLRVLGEPADRTARKPAAGQGGYAHHRRHPSQPGTRDRRRATSARICSTG